MTVLVTFDVIGVPAPQGSKRAFVANGRAVMKESGGDKFASWRNAVATVARHHAARTPLDGALGLTIEFRFPMPASRSKRVRQLGRIPKTTAPDTSKLVRCVEDALQAAGLVVDDARFTTIEACKVETVGWSGAVITVTREEEEGGST